MGPIDFGGQVVLVTGAGRGLGEAYARTFAERGADVVLHDAGVDADGRGGDSEVARAAAERIVASGGRASAVDGDLRDREVCERLVSSAIEEHGRLDVLVHNAGVVLWEDERAPEDDIWAHTMAVTLDAPFALVRAALPHMRDRGSGRIVLTTSGRATSVASSRPGLVAYSAAKLGVVGLMNGFAAGLADVDVEINAISPVAATRVLRRDAPELTTAAVAPGVLLLASDRVTTSGAVLAAMGGGFALEGWQEGPLVDLGGTPSPDEVLDRFPELRGGD